jgi:hypothetical protein
VPQCIKLVEEQHAGGIAARAVENRTDAAFALPEPMVQNVGDSAPAVGQQAGQMQPQLDHIGAAFNGSGQLPNNRVLTQRFLPT